MGRSVGAPVRQGRDLALALQPCIGVTTTWPDHPRPGWRTRLTSPGVSTEFFFVPVMIVAHPPTHAATINKAPRCIFSRSNI